VVAVVDPNPGARLSSRWLLESEGYRVHAFARVEAFAAAVFPSPPAALVLDMVRPGGNGLDKLGRLAGRRDCPPILIASAHASLDFAVAAMKLGAADFVQKPYAPAELLRALAGLTRPGFRGAGARETAHLVKALTDRQRQILKAMIRGRANKAIAWELKISVRTVESYRADLFRRLGTRSTVEAVRIALAAGLDGS
jgi:FixJ family two-component response regulator